jgi:small subunit ribosomal protein S6
VTGTYEIGFIVTPDSPDEEVKKIIESVSGIIKKSNGTVTRVDEWGVRKLAYPIKKYSDGIYVFVLAETADGQMISQVERRLRQLERVVRFITLRLDERLKKSNKLTKKWKKIERVNRSKQEAIKAESGHEAGEPQETHDAN